MSENRNSPLRLGVIGTGQIAGIILPMLDRERIVVTAVTDLNATAAEALVAKLSGARMLPDQASLLAASDVDAVYLATPPFTHRALVEAALAAGKHVACEKPWMLNPAEARAIQAEIDAHPDLRVTCCSSRFSHTPAVRAAQALLAAGALGASKTARFVFSTGVPKPPATTLPAWKTRVASAGGGLTFDWGFYDLDLMHRLFGPAFDPVEVFGVVDAPTSPESELDGGFDAIIRCASGLRIFWQRRPEYGPNKEVVEIRGEAGGLDLPFSPGAADPVLRRHGRTAEFKLETTEASDRVTSWHDILAGPLYELADAALRGAAFPTPTSRQILFHDIVDALHQSARTGQPTPVAR